MVPWPPELKLCREMGTHPQRVIFFVWTGYPNPQGQGAIKIHAFQTVCGLPSKDNIGSKEKKIWEKRNI